MINMMTMTTINTTMAKKTTTKTTTFTMNMIMTKDHNKDKIFVLNFDGLIPFDLDFLLFVLLVIYFKG